MDDINALVYLGIDVENPMQHLLPHIVHSVRESWQVISNTHEDNTDINIHLAGPHTFVICCTAGNVILNGILRTEEPVAEFLPERDQFEQLKFSSS